MKTSEPLQHAPQEQAPVAQATLPAPRLESKVPETPCGAGAKVGHAGASNQKACIPTAPPWKFDTQERNGQVIMQCPASPGTAYQRPKLYCKDVFPTGDAAMPERFKYPNKALTLLSDLTLIPRRIALNTNDSSINKLTFRRRRTNYHGGLKYLGGDAFVPRRADYSSPSISVDFPLYYVDTEHPDIYGHFLIEVIPDLWAFKMLGDRSIKLATSVKMNKSYLAMLSALGIAEKDVVVLDGPTRVREIYQPTPMIQRRRFLDPACRDIFDRIKALSWKSAVNAPERIYVSRSKAGGRDLDNETLIERLFEEFGFTVVHPQELPIEDQIKMFDGAKMIAGTGGSAMHNTIYSSAEAKVLILCTTTWLVLMDSLICQQPGQLGYVFGDTLRDDLSGRHKGRWTINILNVRKALKEHFGL